MAYFSAPERDAEKDDETDERWRSLQSSPGTRLGDGDLDTHDHGPDFDQRPRTSTEEEEKEDDDDGIGAAPLPLSDAITISSSKPGTSTQTPQQQQPTPPSKLTQILSRISTHRSHPIDPSPPPDGGLRAWLQVCAGHLVIMNTWGFVNSFGIFETYYVTAFSRSASDIAWIGSIQVFILFFIGTWTGRASDAGYFRLILLLGSTLQVVGLFAAAQATQYWHLFLAQGLCLGLADGCLFTPTMSVTSTYWLRRRGIAIAIVACGSATGGLIFPAMVQQLLPRVGFPWTMRSLGFLSLFTTILANLMSHQRLPPRRTGSIVEWAAFKDRTYAATCAGMFFTYLGVYYPFFYLASYARSVVGLPYTSTLNLILLLNAMGAPGRLVPNYLSDRVTGPVNIMTLMVFLASLTVFCLAAVTSIGGLYAWSACYGIMGGAMQSLFPAMLASLTAEHERNKMGVRMGMCFTITAFSVLVGPPVEGVLVDVGTGGGEGGGGGVRLYTWSCVFAGVAMMIGAGCMVFARVARSGWVLRIKM